MVTVAYKLATHVQVCIVKGSSSYDTILKMTQKEASYFISSVHTQLTVPRPTDYDMKVN